MVTEYLPRTSFEANAAVVENGHKESDHKKDSSAPQTRPPHIVIIVENMTLPADRRVWQEATSLAALGWRVSVICPKMGKWRLPYERLENVDIYRHPLPVEASGIAGYLFEYGPALLFEAYHLLKLGLDKIDIVQICNPPDFLFIPALMAKKFGGAKVVFDHHDLTPELLAEKTGRASGLLYRFACWAERQTFKCADHIISTNAAFKQIAMERGGKEDHGVDIVYSAPDLNRLGSPKADPSLKKGAGKLALWVGMIGSQDGVHLLIDAMDDLRAEDLHLLIVGDGPERVRLEKYVEQQNLQSAITFSGFLSGDALATAFASADIGVGSDPKNAFNDRLAMNKVMEYMAAGLPIAMFDLAECRNIAGPAALYAENNDPHNLAGAIKTLLHDDALYQQMQRAGLERVASTYNWDAQKTTYQSVFHKLLEAV